MDKRILKTKNNLTNTLLILIKEKNIYDITVLELCNKANINRTTFYKYYKDIPDLLKNIENTLVEELKENINDIKRNYLITFANKTIETIAKHKDIYSVILGPNGDHTFLRQILNLVYEESIAEWQKLLRKASIEDLEKIYNFIVNGTIGIITSWLNNNCNENPSNLTIFINKICMSGLSSFI